MKRASLAGDEALHEECNRQWRAPAEVISQWADADSVDARLLKHEVRGLWWETLALTRATLLVTREYEHLAMALSVKAGRPHVTFLPVPHPSGLAVDRKRNIVYLASTRNPNQIYDLKPADGLMPRADVRGATLDSRPLMPVRSRFYPGSLYIHDLALVGDALYSNAVGQNSVVKLKEAGGFDRAWWPRCVESEDGPVFDRNLIQLNSIAAGKSLAGSYFSASTDKITGRRPGHRNFAVKERGVIFSGRTREPIAWGLTRPHSARLFDKSVWVDNSGYGELGRIVNGRFEAVVKLEGWTRGLAFKDQIAFVGTSRVLPRFQNYAPGLRVDKSVCGVHAVDVRTGRILGSILWPAGNQIFAVEWMDAKAATGFPFVYGRKRSTERERLLFYAYQT